MMYIVLDNTGEHLLMAAAEVVGGADDLSDDEWGDGANFTDVAGVRYYTDGDGGVFRASGSTVEVSYERAAELGVTQLMHDMFADVDPEDAHEGAFVGVSVAKECANFIESDKDLMCICAFRMAVKDLRSGRLETACWRIRSDMDKCNETQLETLRGYVKNLNT